jgi:hypothetical protein
MGPRVVQVSRQSLQNRPHLSESHWLWTLLSLTKFPVMLHIREAAFSEFANKIQGC